MTNEELKRLAVILTDFGDLTDAQRQELRKAVESWAALEWRPGSERPGDPTRWYQFRWTNDPKAPPFIGRWDGIFGIRRAHDDRLISGNNVEYLDGALPPVPTEER